MSFMNEVLEKNIPIWDECIATPFVQEMKAGTLPFECFKEYMIQDSIYLKHYARVYGKEIYHAKTLRDIQLYYSVLSFVTDTESAVRLRYLEQFGMTDDDIESIAPLPENQRYIDFLLETAERGDEKEMLMAVQKSEGVYLQGLKYSLTDATLTSTFPIGTSNEFIGEKSRISVKNGTLMIVFPKEAKEKIL